MPPRITHIPHFAEKSSIRTISLVPCSTPSVNLGHGALSFQGIPTGQQISFALECGDNLRRSPNFATLVRNGERQRQRSPISPEQQSRLDPDAEGGSRCHRQANGEVRGRVLAGNRQDGKVAY
jgi:hypothetical protein